MATEAIEQVPATDGADAPKKGNGLLLMLGVAGIAAGAAVGTLLVGPKLTAHADAKATAAARAPKIDPTKVEVPVVHEMANLVLNPAGTGGTRFLMVTATFQVKDDATKESFKNRDSELRDLILSILGKKTVDQLTDMGRRDDIRKEVIDSVSSRFPKGSVITLYFPQFVIQ